ncbi:hypothetical protein BDV95DRAFT_573778 [Massariosphaeria phaeospora]|uniref:Plasma membrane proteolipid 3 n=1 Tax=Massariosphaeria phaeospora TaxID=100035 RepID=A0A7C8I5H2_9PLEO|nr:hypothetical protein BDV95DRAFT_573778 [Massariosphaeria phaeospora]
MMISALLIILITIFVPPLGVFMLAGCGMDLLINILLTMLGYVHALRSYPTPTPVHFTSLHFTCST